MNKKSMMIGLMALMVSCIGASPCGASATNCEKVSTATASAEETAFVSKLSATQRQAFSLMNVEQRLEVLGTARKGTVSPDAAVDNVMNKHHLAVVDGVLKTKTSDIK